MKTAPLLTAAWFSILCAAGAADEIRFTISTDVARQINASDSSQYVSEFGDAIGPFAHVGSAEVSANGKAAFAVPGGASTTSTSPDIPPNHTLQVEYFVNERGHGFAVIHKRLTNSAQEVEAEEAGGEGPYEHIQLASAAERAVSTGNVKLLESLLQAGLSIDLPLVFDSGWTALHLSAIHNQPEVAKALLANGASLEVRDKSGRRPIDDAFEDNAQALCEVLRKPERRESKIGPFPEPLLEELFSTGSKPDDGIRFLSINGQDPSDELLRYFLRIWPNTRPRSMAQEVPPDVAEKDKATSCYRDIKTHDYGLVVELEVTPAKDPATYDWSHRQATGPSLSGGGTKGKVSKVFGYWIKHSTHGWDE